MTVYGLTKQQAAALDFIKKSLERGVSPSYGEICDGIGIKSKSSITRLVNSLRQRGHITFKENCGRSIALTTDSAIGNNDRCEAALRLIISAYGDQHTSRYCTEIAKLALGETP